jgi:hypothetical protein
MSVSMCGCCRERVEPVLVMGVQLTVCPRCDRLPCSKCGVVDMSGVRQRCGYCDHDINLLRRGR